MGGHIFIAIIILLITGDFLTHSEKLASSGAHLPIFIIIAIGACICFLYVLKTIIVKAKETWKYHGAEHKTIYAYENGMELTLENVRGCPRVARRCGTNFGVFFILFCVAFSFWIKYDSVTLICSYALAYELFDLKNGDQIPVLKWLFKFGGFCQHKFLTAEPTDAQILAAIETMKRLTAMNSSKAAP